jgi:hypothetical protein
MRHVLKAFGAASIGTTAGYALYQIRSRRSAGTDAEVAQARLAAPLATTLLAAVLGLLFGRRARCVAFAAGFALAAVFGLEIEQRAAGMRRPATTEAG